MDFFKSIESILQKPTDAIIGIFIGWLLTIATSWFRNRRDDRKPYRAVLFHLIKVYGLIKSIDQPAFEKAMQLVFSKIPELKGASIDDPMFSLMTSFLIAEQVKAVQTNELPTLSASFSECILEIARLDAFLALRFSNSVNIKETIERLDAVSNMITEKINSENHEQVGDIPPIFDDFKPLLLTKTLQDLEADIRRLARKLSLLEQYKTRKELRATKVTFSEEAIERAATFLSEWVAILKSKYNLD